MNNKIELLEYRLPDYLGCYLINGDTEGLDIMEINEINYFLQTEGVSILSMNEDSNFYYSNDLNNMGANCSTYIAVKNS